MSTNVSRSENEKSPQPAGASPTGWGRAFFSFWELSLEGGLPLHGDLPIHLRHRLKDSTFFIGSGSDTLSLRCFGGDQPALLKQFVHKLRHELMTYFIVSVFVAQAADLKFLCGILRNRGYNVEIASLCPALFQDIPRDLVPPCLQL